MTRADGTTEASGLNWRWVFVGLSVAAVAIAVAVVIALAVSSTPWPEDADAVFVIAGLASAVVGAVLVARRPQNAVGKLLVLFGSIWLLETSSRVYLWMSLHTSLPLTGLAVWCVASMSVLAWGLVPLLLAVYPTGRLATSWMRRPVRVYVALLALFTLWYMVSPASIPGYGEHLADFVNPLGVEALAAFEAGPWGQAVVIASSASVVSMMLLSLVDLVRRWRSSRGLEGLQIRALALGGLIMVLLFLVGTALFALNAPTMVQNSTTTLALSAPSLAVGLAILRYRLYEIDRLISRTVSYALVVGLLALVVAFIAIGLPRVVGVPEENPVLVAAATLAAAGLFNPLRRRVLDMVDRRFNRARYDAQQEVEHFSERLRAELDVAEIADEVMVVVAKTMQPASTSVWIREGR